MRHQHAVGSGSLCLRHRGSIARPGRSNTVQSSIQPTTLAVSHQLFGKNGLVVWQPVTLGGELIMCGGICTMKARGFLL